MACYIHPYSLPPLLPPTTPTPPPSAVKTHHPFESNQYHTLPFFERNGYSLPILKPKPPTPTSSEVYPQSLDAAFKFPVIGRLFPWEEVCLKDLCDSLHCGLHPSCTWRLLPLGNGFYFMQFTCVGDLAKVASMASLTFKFGTMQIITKWSPEFNVYRDRTMSSSVTFVRWCPPSPSWIKVNTDGSARGGLSSCGGVFRDSRGAVLGCFSLTLETGAAALEAEISACIAALDIAHHHGWNKIWLESDCTKVVELLALRSTGVPTQLNKGWMRVLAYLQRMEFRVSHIYRQGNRVADALADPEMEKGWWPYAIPAISELVYEDSIGCVNTRIRA